MSPGLMMKVAGLFGKKPSELTNEQVSDLLRTFAPDIEYSDSLKELALKVLQDADVDTVADIMGRPDVLKSLALVVVPPPPSGLLRACGHCGEINLID